MFFRCMRHLRAAAQRYTHCLCLRFVPNERLILTDKRVQALCHPWAVCSLLRHPTAARFILVDSPWNSTVPVVVLHDRGQAVSLTPALPTSPPLWPLPPGDPLAPQPSPPIPCGTPPC